MMLRRGSVSLLTEWEREGMFLSGGKGKTKGGWGSDN